MKMSEKNFEKKRILIFLRCFGMGGAERQAALLANFLVNEGAIVAVWAYSEIGPICEFLDERVAVKSIFFDPRNQHDDRRKRKTWELFKLVVRIGLFRPDAILPYTQTPNEDMCNIWKWTGAKVCVWNQRGSGTWSSGSESEKKAVARCPMFVTNSITGKNALNELVGPSAKCIIHIPNAVVLDEPTKDAAVWRRNLNIDEKKDFVALMIANLTLAKDHETVIRAWKTVVRDNVSGTRPVLLLAGTFVSTHEKMKSLASELGIADSVRFLGRVRDISGLLQVSDLGVFSSFDEGCPNGVLECMAAGLAVVASDIIGTREALGEGNFGLVPLKAEGAFAEKVVQFIGDDENRQKVGFDNLHRVKTHFSPDLTFKMYVDLLNGFI